MRIGGCLRWRLPQLRLPPRGSLVQWAPLKFYTTANPQLDSPLVYTAINNTGKVIRSGAQISRQSFLRENHLHTRDLRHIDGQAALVPRILVQNGQILVNMMDMRVLIRKDKVLLFESRDPKVSERLGMLSYDFSIKLSRVAEAGQPYEQVALETVLIHAIAYLEIQLTKVLTSIELLLNNLENHVDRERLRDLLVGSQELNRCYHKALAVRKALEDAMDDEDDISKMYLTSGKAPTSDSENSMDIELLLETYYKQADELVQQADKTSKDVETTEEIVNMIIDTNRNALMLFRLQVSVITVAIALSMFIADLYGMNLENFIEETNWGMPAVIVMLIFVNIIGTIYNFRMLKHTKHISMTGVMTSIGGNKRKEMMHRWLKHHHR